MRKTLLPLIAVALAPLPGVAHAQGGACLALKSGRYENMQHQAFRLDVECRRLVITDLKRNLPYRIDLDATNDIPLGVDEKSDPQAKQTSVKMKDMQVVRADGDMTHSEVTGKLELTIPLDKMAAAKVARPITLKFRAPFDVQTLNYAGGANLFLTVPEGLELVDADLPIEGAMKQAFLSGANTILGLFSSSITGRIHERLTFVSDK